MNKWYFKAITNQISALMRCGVTSQGDWRQTFRESVRVLSSRAQMSMEDNAWAVVDKTTILSQNVEHKPPSNVAPRSSRTEIPTAPLWKPTITQPQTNLIHWILIYVRQYRIQRWHEYVVSHICSYLVHNKFLGKHANAHWSTTEIDFKEKEPN